MVGTFDDFHIVLDDEDAVAAFYQRVEGMQQALDVVEVQTRRGLVEDEEGRLLFLLSDEVGQLYTLVLTAGERRGVLTELDVSEADFFERLQARDDGFTTVEEFNGLADGHIEHVVDILVLVADVEDIVLEAVTVTGFTLEDEIGHKIYKTLTELATALRVSKIVTVEPMEGYKVDFEQSPMDLIGVIVNLTDYKVGADKGGEINLFDDFDIDYNQFKYLIETRISGALVKPFSAMTVYKKVTQ